jgi:excisionase family DNA binding protein
MISTTPLAHSVTDAARLLGIGRTALYELIGRGELPTVRIGSRRLIRDADLRAYLDALVRKEAA